MDEIEIRREPKKPTLIMIKKKNLILLLVVAMLMGGILSGTVLYATKLGTNYVSVEKNDYKQMAAMQKKYAKLESLWQYIDKRYYIPVDEKKLEEGIYKGLFSGLEDPYSAYLNEEEYKELMESTSGEYDGVGVTMAPTKDGNIIIMAVTEGSPAAEAGIRAGDYLLEVAGTVYNAANMELAANSLRGKSGTSVSVVIVRDNQKKTFDLRRRTITEQSVASKMLDGNIGYIRIASFSEHTTEDFRQALSGMEQKDVKGLVIDLRGNPGGVVDSGVEIADMLLDAGIVTYTVDRAEEKNYYKSKDGKTELPYVMLVNGGTASTSEILSAAVKDRKGGKLIGVTTFGKGIIQSIEGLRTGEGIKLTVMQYFSPEGNEIHHKGVTPDVVVELSEEDYDENGILINDKQLTKAIELLNK